MAAARTCRIRRSCASARPDPHPETGFASRGAGPSKPSPHPLRWRLRHVRSGLHSATADARGPSGTDASCRARRRGSRTAGRRPRHGCDSRVPAPACTGGPAPGSQATRRTRWTAPASSTRTRPGSTPLRRAASSETARTSVCRSVLAACGPGVGAGAIGAGVMGGGVMGAGTADAHPASRPAATRKIAAEPCSRTECAPVPMSNEAMPSS